MLLGKAPDVLGPGVAVDRGKSIASGGRRVRPGLRQQRIELLWQSLPLMWFGITP
jgi:hypothetical protein